MKKTLIAVALAAASFEGLAQTNEVPQRLPVGLSFDMAWDLDVDGDATVWFELLSGTNVVQAWNTNGFRIRGVTNGVTSFEGTVTNGVVKGMTNLTVVGVSAWLESKTNWAHKARSEPSTNWWVKPVGKPGQSQGIRKL